MMPSTKEIIKSNIKFVDFQFFGYIFSSLVLVFGSKIILITKNLNFCQEYREKSITISIILKKFYESTEEEKSKFKSFINLNLIVNFLVICIGFHERVYLLVVFSLFMFQLYDNMFFSPKTYIEKFQSFIIGFFLLNASFFLGLIDDRFALKV